MTKGKMMEPINLIKKEKVNNLIILTRSSNKELLNKIDSNKKRSPLNIYLVDPEELDLPLKHFHENNPSILPSNLHNSIIWNRVSGTNYSDYDYLVTQELCSLGATALNDPALYINYRDKYAQLLHLRRHQIPVLETYYLPNHNTEMINSSGPFVVKTLRGAKGRGVIKLENISALKDFLTLTSSMGDNRFIIQELIEFAHEYRVLMLGGEVLQHLKKSPLPGEWKHGIETAKWEQLSETPEDLVEILSKIDHIEKKYFYAVDYIRNNDKLYILEVNTSPGITSLNNSQVSRVLNEVTDFI